MFLCREKELHMLDEKYNSGSAEFIVLYGRRRIGKTTLLTEFLKDKESIYYTCLETSSLLQLKTFSDLILSFDKSNVDENIHLDDWESCFNRLYKISKDKRIVVVLDEFQYLVNQDKSIPSIIQKVWDLKLKDSKIMFVITGSSISFIESDLLGYKNPLYARATSNYKLQPLSYYDCAKFVENYSYQDKIIAYAITSGIPLYISLFNKNKSLKQNIIDLILKGDGTLHDEVEFLLRKELRDVSTYNSVITSIALGNQTYKNIATSSNVPINSLSKYLNNLKTIQIIEKENPQYSSLKDVENQHAGLYRIKDGLFRFYYRYYLPNSSIFDISDLNKAYDLIIQPTLHDFSSSAFEQACILYLYKQNDLDKLPTYFTSFKRWWGQVEKTDEKGKKQITNEEIDIVGKSLDKKITILGECKFTSLPFDSHQYHRLIHKLNLDTEVYYYLFSLNGFTQQLIDEAKDNKYIKLVPIEDLFNN